MVVASIKYPPHNTHNRWVFKPLRATLGDVIPGDVIADDVIIGDVIAGDVITGSIIHVATSRYEFVIQTVYKQARQVFISYACMVNYKLH